jgi:hypothetical protein
LHYTMPFTSVMNSEVELKEGSELENYTEFNVKKQRNIDINKSNNSTLDRPKLEEDATYYMSATANRKSLLDRIIIGVCVVLVLY